MNRAVHIARRGALRAARRVRNTLDIPRLTRYSFRWDALTGALTGMYMGLVFPFLTKIARGDLHTAQVAVSVMVAAPFFGNLFSPLWARRMEGRDKLPFCFRSWIIARFLLLLMPVAVTGNVFVALIAGLQIVGTISAPAYASLMRDIYPDHARGRLMGYVRAGMQATMFFTTLIAGRVMDHGVSYRWLFPLAGLLGILAAMAFGHVKSLPRQETPSTSAVDQPDAPVKDSQFMRDTVAILVHNVPYRWFALSVFVYGAANLMVQPLYGLYQVDVLHITSTEIANLANTASFFSILGAFFWGRFMDRRGAPMTVMYGIACIALIPAVYMVARSTLWLTMAAALSGFGSAGIELSYLSSILLYAERAKTAQYQSLHSMLLGVRGVLAPIIGVPLMHSIGYARTFGLALLIMIVGAFIQLKATRSSTRPVIVA